MIEILASIKNIIKNIPKQAKKPLDWKVLILVTLICIFGIIMIWSASMYNAKLEGNEFKYVFKQFKYFIFGFVIMLLVSVLDYRYVKKLSLLVMVISLVLLVMVALKPDTDSVKGAVRYISIFGITIMPAEVVKITVLMSLSYLAELYIDNIKSFKLFVYMLLIMAPICLLIYKQPALSTMIIVAALFVLLYFYAGGNLGYLSGLIVTGVFAVYVFITKTDWRKDRIAGWLDPWSHLLDQGWQPAQSLMALGSGGLWGVGIGNGRAKLKFLPEPQNDYILAIIGEELGLFGCFLLLVAYFVLIFFIVKISFKAKDTFSRLYCIGYASLLAVQVTLNYMIVSNMMPSTGVILPFVSAGGSSIITLLAGMGLVLNISRNVSESAKKRTD